MRLNFRKIAAVASSLAMVGLTAGTAFAASYPSPFTGSGNFAVVYGANAPGGLDRTQATSIAEDLQGTGGTATVTGGESFMLDKTSNHFNFNEALNGVFTSLDSEEMTTFLADGTYNDGDVDEDFEQTITLGTKQLTLFADPDYANDAPTVGFWWTNAQEVLRYTEEFDDPVNTTEMVDTDLPLLGAEYYVLAASPLQIDVLDTAEKTFLNIGETATVAGKSVTLTYVDSNSAKFTVGGTATGDLAENDELKLADDSYIVVTDISYQDYAGGVQGAEFAIGSGKIELIDGSEAQLNNEDIDGLEVDITNSSTGTIDSIVLIWKSDRDTFLTESNAVVMPGFDKVQLTFGGLNFPSSSETVSVQNGDTLTVSMGNYAFPLMWYDSVNDDAAFGEDNGLLKVATAVANYTSPAVNLTGGLDLAEDNRFIVTSIGTDLSDVETLYYEVSSIENNSGTINVELNDILGTHDLTFDGVGTAKAKDVGDVTITLVAVNGTVAGRAYLNFTTAVSGATIYYNRLVSDKGLVISWPTDADEASENSTGGILTFQEANKDDDLASGRAFTATVKNTTNEKLHVSTHNLTASDEEESDDHFIGYVPSDLASKFTFDTSADEYDFSIEYYGIEVTADVNVVGGGTVSSETPSLGGVLVTDAEVASVSSKNLVVVGGSCVNSVAARLLSVSAGTCTSAWTTATDVGSGQYLIQSFTSPYSSGKTAILVAGYEAAETAAGASRLMNQPATVDTAVGNKYIYAVGSSGTSTLVSGP